MKPTRTIFCLAIVMLSSIHPAIHAQSPLPPERLGNLLAEVVRDAVPREYERAKNWDHTKRITTGIRFDGRPIRMKIHRRKKEVPHGVWKKYRVRIVEPAPDGKPATDEALTVEVSNLRSLEAGRAGCTLTLAAKLDGWAQVRNYNRGVHLGTITFEGESMLRVSIDCEVGFGLTQGERLPALAIDPTVTAARVEVDDFRMRRIGEIKGKLAKEMGRGLRRVIEDRLTGPKLAEKINRSIEKRREKLQLDPSALIAQRPEPAASSPVD